MNTLLTTANPNTAMTNKLQALVNLAAALGCEEPPATCHPCIEPAAGPMLTGQQIVVLDRGFVYVGDISREGDFLMIRNAYNIRRWGTTKGLGELVNGPTKDTVLDRVGEVMAPMKSLIYLIPCSGF